MEALRCPGCSRRLRPAPAAGEVRCPLCGAVFTPAPGPPVVPVVDPAPARAIGPAAAPPVARPWWGRWANVGLFLLAWCVGVGGVYWAIRRAGLGDDASVGAKAWDAWADWFLKHAGPPTRREWQLFDQMVRQYPAKLAPFVRGALLARDERYVDADAAFAAGLADPPPGDITRFDLYRARACYYAGGDVVATYDAIGPGAVEPLAEALKIDGDDEALEKLLARVEVVEGLDEALLGVRAEMYARMGRTDEALADWAALEGRPASVIAALARAGKAVEAYRKAPHGQVFLDAAAALGDDRPEDLKGLVEARRLDAADDPMVAYYAGKVLERAGDHAAAAAAFEQTARALRGRRAGAYYLAMARLGLATVGWRRLGMRRDHIPLLCDVLRAEGRGAELERFALHLRHAQGETAESIEGEIAANLLQGRVDRAVALYRRYSARLGATERLLVTQVFALTGHDLDWYREQPDRLAAFESLHGYDVSIRLLEAHQADHPDDPALHLAWGRLYLRRKDHAQAEARFRRAMGGQDEATRAEAEAGWGRALVGLGRTAEAARAARGLAGLDAIAVACVEERRPDQLRELLALQQKRGDRVPVRWVIAGAWLGGEHASVVDRCRLLGRALSVELQHSPQVGTWYTESLRALGRHQEADAERRRLGRRPPVAPGG